MDWSMLMEAQLVQPLYNQKYPSAASAGTKLKGHQQEDKVMCAVTSIAKTLGLEVQNWVKTRIETDNRMARYDITGTSDHRPKRWYKVNGEYRTNFI